MKRFSIAREKFIRSRLGVSEAICEIICEADGREGRTFGSGSGRAMLREEGDPKTSEEGRERRGNVRDLISLNFH